MNLTRKEIEFLKEIHEAEERGFPVTFGEHDKLKVEEYQKKYGDVHISLTFAGLIKGSISCFSGLELTEKGKMELQLALAREDKKAEKKADEKRKFKLDIISLILGTCIGTVTGSVVTIFIYWLISRI